MTNKPATESTREQCLPESFNPSRVDLKPPEVLQAALSQREERSSYPAPGSGFLIKLIKSVKNPLRHPNTGITQE